MTTRLMLVAALALAACGGPNSDPPRPVGPVEVTTAYSIGPSVHCFWADYETEHPATWSTANSDGTITEHLSTVHACVWNCATLDGTLYRFVGLAWENRGDGWGAPGSQVPMLTLDGNSRAPDATGCAVTP
jgi:hypothetical protein